MWFLWIQLVWAAPCETDTSDAVTRAADQVLASYAATDESGFDAAHADLKTGIPCLSSALSPEQVALIHQAKALGAFVDGELAATRKSWAAVQTLAPDWAPDPSWMPDGHPLRTQWEGAPKSQERATLERSPEGGWTVDGVPSPDVPAERAYLLQGYDAAGALVHAGYHYSIAEVPQLDFAELDPTARARRTRRIHTYGTVGASALGAGALATLGMAASSAGQARDDQTKIKDVRDHASKANTLTTLSAGLGGGAVAVATATWVVHW